MDETGHGSHAQRVLVTGASGFVGAQFAADLEASGRTVHRIGRATLARLLAEPAAAEALRDELRGHRAVVHLAGRAHVLEETSQSLLDVYRAANRDTTLALAHAVVRAGVRRFVFVSSIRVNGSSSRRPFRADDVAAPDEPYAISKFEAELGLHALARESGLEVVVVRPPLVYGPHVKANFLRLLRLAASGLPLPLGSIGGTRSLVSIWNLCDLLLRCVEHPAAPGRTLLAGDGEDITLPALIRALAAAMGRPCRIFPVPESLVRLAAAAAGKASTFDKLTATLQVDITETRRALEWTAPVSLAEGLRRTAQWYAQDVLHATSGLRGDAGR